MYRKSTILNWICDFGLIFVICRPRIWTNSSQRFHQINFIFGVFHLKALLKLNCRAFEFSSRDSPVTLRRNLMFRHQNSTRSYSVLHCPRGLRCSVYDQSPALNRSIWSYLVILIAPPSGNRKWLARCFDVAVLSWWSMWCQTCSNPCLRGWWSKSWHKIEFSSEDLPMVTRRISMLRHDWKTCSNLPMRCPIWTTIDTLDEASKLNK